MFHFLSTSLMVKNKIFTSLFILYFYDLTSNPRFCFSSCILYQDAHYLSSSTPFTFRNCLFLKVSYQSVIMNEASSFNIDSNQLFLLHHLKRKTGENKRFSIPSLSYFALFRANNTHGCLLLLFVILLKQVIYTIYYIHIC